jgi:site-specific recombinase XerD
MIEDLRIRNYSPRTIQIYVRCVTQFAKYFGRSPERLSTEEIREYQRYLVEDKKVSWSSFNQTVNALRFLYGRTLGREEHIEQIPFSRPERRLPVVLSVGEVSRLFRYVRGRKPLMVFQTMYGTGLRLMEALNLKPGHIDSDRMVIRVERGKGRKDRYVSLPPTLLRLLREYWKDYRPQTWLFPNRTQKYPLHTTTVQRAFREAALRAGIDKPVSTHTLRHCFATHLLEAGTDLRTIQMLLGHGSLTTSAIYLHVAVAAEQRRHDTADLLKLSEEVPAKR